MWVSIDFATGNLVGPEIIYGVRTLSDLKGYFQDEQARAAMDQSAVVYRTQAFEPVPAGKEGAICCATTFLEPGRVGDEFFLTRGHFHANPDRPELEVVISGTGALILMTEDRQTRYEEMRPGSVHPVPPRTAHRAANIGQTPLVFISYWPSETGHDYKTIAEQGFSARMRVVSGAPTLVPED